jgi:hypothetical protein
VRRSALTPSFIYDDRTGRYAEAQSRRFVKNSAVRNALDRALDDASANVATLTESLRGGAVSLAQWQVAMAREVKSVHLASAALAKGGWAEMAPKDYGRAGQRIRFHYEKLANFAQRLDGTLARRAQMYIQAGRGTFHAVERAEKERGGAVEERNILHARDSCEGCLAADALGWVPIGTLPLPGSRTCRANCRCSVEYRGVVA